MSEEKISHGCYAPSYFGGFKCIADRCTHSCCIDWEIVIDDHTLEKYKSLKCGIEKTVSECDGEYCFILKEDGRCPHLSDTGLCDIITTHGEEYLSEICKSHPRFYNYIGERCECGLGIVCEEACRLVLECEKPFPLLPACGGEQCNRPEDSPRHDILFERDKILNLTSEDGTGLDEIVQRLKAEYRIPEIYMKSELPERFLKLEILDTGWEQMLKKAKNMPDFAAPCDISFDKYFKRLLMYFVYRHVSTAESREELSARLGFAILSTEMIKHLFLLSGELSQSSILFIARAYSAEIEYSEDNTDELIFEFFAEC